MAFADQIFWVYPWDVTDSTVGSRLRAIRGLGASAISIPFAYHSLRALAPHRQGCKVFSFPAALGFRPRPGEFPDPGIQPLFPPWATDEGPVPSLVTEAEKIGLRVKAWTVVFHSTPLAMANPDSVPANCFGDTFGHALCPSAPRAREYALRLVRAVAARPIHELELEALGFYGYEHLSMHDKCGIAFDLFHHFLFSCCFCPHCGRNFESAGLDSNFLAAKFRERLLAFFEGKVATIHGAVHAREELGQLLNEDMAEALLRARSQCVLSLLREIRDAVPKNIALTLSSGLSPFEFGALFAADPQETIQVADRLLLVVFEPNETAFRRRFETALNCVSDRSRWIGGIRVFPPDAASEQTIESRLAFLHEKGLQAVQIYHYGLAPTNLLMATAKVLKKLEGAPRD
jgi:hypothetical protein